jgi:hypothetical protein
MEQRNYIAPEIQQQMNAIEHAVATLRDLGVPYVVGIQTDPDNKLSILSNMPPETNASMLAAHFDLTIWDAVKKDIQTQWP